MLVVDVGLVVAVAVVGGVVVVVVVDETAGFQILNTQKVGSVRGADSGPIPEGMIRSSAPSSARQMLTAEFSSTGYTCKVPREGCDE